MDSVDLHVWFGSGRNKFVQLLIRSRNSSGRFVRSLMSTLESSMELYSTEYTSDFTDRKCITKYKQLSMSHDRQIFKVALIK